MFRPGGYSSEEDDIYDEFGFDDYYTNNKFNENRPQLSEEEIRRNKLEQLYNGIIYGDVELVSKYIQEGLDVNSTLRGGWTPLLLASSYGNDKLAIELIKLGADVNCTKDMETPLMGACRCPSTTAPFESTFEIVKYLVANKADVNFKNRKRMTALMFAASTGNILVIEYLLNFCNKDDVDNQGWSALFWAVNDNNYEAFIMLLEAGLDCTKKDVRRMTPLDYAKLRGCRKIIELLPDPDKCKNEVMMIETDYHFYQEIKSLKFERDVYIMLNAVKCLHLYKMFSDNGIDLYTFLTLTRKKLEEIGIKMPLMQNRILGGIYRFHKHSFQKKSVPAVPKNVVYTTTDIANAVFTSMRQMRAMSGSLKYLELNMDFAEFSDKGPLVRQLVKIENTVLGMERMCKVLKQRAIKWDKDNAPVDLIKPNKKRWTFTTKLISISAFITIFVYVKMKL